MNSTQLAVLLGKYYTALDEAVDDLKEKLPAECSEERKTVFNQPVAVYPILSGIQDVVDDLKFDIDMLTKDSEK